VTSERFTARGLLVRSVTRHARGFTACSALLIVWQLCETLVPVTIGVVIDQAVAPGDLGALALWLAVMALQFALLSYSYRFGSRLGYAATELEKHQERVEVSEHALAPDGARSDLLPGEILSLATSDAELAGHTPWVLTHVAAWLVGLAVSAWALLRIDLGVGLLVLAGVPTSLLLVQLVTPHISRSSEAQQESIGRATGTATDLVRGLRPLKGIGAERAAVARYRVLSQQAKDASIRSTSSFGILDALAAGLNGLMLAVVALVAGRAALSGDLSVGELVAVVGLAQYLGEPILGLAYTSAQLASAHAAARRLAAYLSTPALVRHGDRTPDAPLPQVELRDLTGGSLDGLALTTRPGELLGVVVTEPADADTLATALSGELNPEERSGTLSLGGVGYEELELPLLRATVVVDRHHVDVFEGTLRSNIGAGPDTDLAAVLEASAVTDVVGLYDDGLDHPTSADGGTLSGGQRQRLALARALAADPPVLVLHHPTTAVDAVTEQQIAAGIRRLRHAPGSERSTLVMTTSPALLAQADRVLVVSGGRVVAEGTHRDLVAREDYAAAVLR
jgi:putative ABC transport system ATP-binding protein